ncbi:hypothetical protein [Paenibacillus sp. BJ-4]|nr:hypothetical protein [Paenibacillus sp. BJ-4]
MPEASSGARQEDAGQILTFHRESRTVTESGYEIRTRHCRVQIAASVH